MVSIVKNNYIKGFKTISGTDSGYADPQCICLIHYFFVFSFLFLFSSLQLDKLLESVQLLFCAFKFIYKLWNMLCFYILHKWPTTPIY